MGRWRKTGAPLVLCPEKDDAALGWDNNRNNNFDYEKNGILTGMHVRSDLISGE